MGKKRKISLRKLKPLTKEPLSPFFMGLSKSQTQSLAIGSIIVGLGLFFLATVTWKNREKLAVATVSPTPTLTKMISATATVRMNEKKQPLVKKLSNTSSKVTYTVEENDNLATIGEKLCHTEGAWVSIAATNNLLYPYTIYPGETYIITCN